jgi:hypothetical protein
MQKYNYNAYDFLNDISDFHTSYAHVLKVCNNHQMQVSCSCV